MDSFERVMNVVDRALDLEQTDRAAFLDRACAGDAKLRRQVETLLGQDVGVP